MNAIRASIFAAVPEAVIDHLGHFGRQPVAEVHEVAVERQSARDQRWACIQQRHARRLVHAAALHPHEAVLDHVDPARHRSRPPILLSSQNQVVERASFFPFTVTGTPDAKPIVTVSSLSGASCGETVMPKSTVATPSTCEIFELPRLVADVQAVLVELEYGLESRRLDRDVLRLAVVDHLGAAGELRCGNFSIRHGAMIFTSGLEGLGGELEPALVVPLAGRPVGEARRPPLRGATLAGRSCAISGRAIDVPSR